jgi:hypothetical protein
VLSAILMNPNISDIISKIQSNKLDLGITLYNPASASDLAKFEKVKRITLPEDIKQFYTFCNGFESEEDMFRIIPLNEILENKRDSYTVGQKDFHIAEYMIYCDMWTIAIDDQDSNNYSIYRTPGGQITLTNSFPNFLDKFLLGGVFNGLYKWEEEIYQTPK